MEHLTPTMRKAMEQGAAQASSSVSIHAQHALDRKVRIDAAIAEKKAAAKARCEAGDHTVIKGVCIVCKQDMPSEEERQRRADVFEANRICIEDTLN